MWGTADRKDVFDQGWSEPPKTTNSHTSQCADTIRHKKFNHKKRLSRMSGLEKLEEYVYLVSGGADKKDERFGVKMGLSPDLQRRRNLLHKRICQAVDGFHTRAV